MLRPVPVVNVPIDDQDPLHAIPFLRIPRRDRHIVEQAETHRPIGFRMVPRRTDGAEGMLNLADHNRIHPGQRSTGKGQKTVKDPALPKGVPHYACLADAVDFILEDDAQ